MTRLEFVAGDVRNFRLRSLVDIIVCNGLIGGPAAHRGDDLQAIWRNFERHLRPGAVILIGDCFHEGHRKNVRHFLELGGEQINTVEDAGGSTLIQWIGAEVD